MTKNIEDYLLLVGLLLILVPTFFLNVYVGCYSLGAVFIMLSLAYAIKEKENKEP